MPSDERDQPFERALARHLSGASGNSACPDAEILAAYHERSLSVEETAHWKEHLAACARCQEALSLVKQSENVLTADEQHQHELEPAAQLSAATAMAARTGMPQVAATTIAPASVPNPAPLRKFRPRAAWSWIVPLGAVAASVIVWVGVHEFRVQRARETQIALNRLPAPLPATPRPNAKEKSKREEAAVAKTQNRGSGQKPMIPASSSSAVQSPSLTSPTPSNELAGNRRKESRPLAVGGSAVLEPSPSVSSYAGSADALQTSPLPAPSTAPAVPPVAAAKVSSQRNEENKKAQFSKAGIAGQLQPPAAAPTMTSAEVVAVPADNLVQTRYIVAPGEKHAWRLGDAGLIEVSTDRGKTWKPQSSGVTADLTAGSATSDKVCWVAGKSGTLLLTADGGKHWSQLSSPISSDLGGVHATSASHASIWDVSNHNSFETNDGGTTWQRTANE
jgi:hypothetical protein